MATINFTPQDGAFNDIVDMIDVLNDTAHKVEFLQDVLTLQPDGKLPESMNTTGLYFIMSDVVNTLRRVSKSLDESDSHTPEPKPMDSNSKDKLQDNLNLLADIVRSEFETVDLALEGLLAVSLHSQINDFQINGVMNAVMKAKDSIRGSVDEAISVIFAPA